MPFLIFTVLYYGISSEHMKCECHIWSYTLDTAIKILMYSRHASCYCLHDFHIDSLGETETYFCIMFMTNKTQA
jgi:hypothetical protein